jgi:drug/metabolite transporter (DMT)-like permease
MVDPGAQRRLPIGALSLALACALAFAGWVVLTRAGHRPDPWIGIVVTCAGLVAAGLVGLRERVLTRQDRHEELAATCVLAVLALGAFAVAQRDAPPWYIWVGLVALAGLAAWFGRPTSPATHRSTRDALHEALRGPVLYRGLSLLGVLLAVSSS